MKRFIAIIAASLFSTVAIAGGAVGTVAPRAKDAKKAAEVKTDQAKDKVPDTKKPADKEKGHVKQKAEHKTKVKAPEKHAETKSSAPTK